MSLLFNLLSIFAIFFLPWSKHLLNSWLQSPSTVILELKKMKFFTASTFSPSICHEVMGPDVMILVFWMLSFKLAFHSPFTSSRVSSVPLWFLPLWWYHLHIWGCCCFSWQFWFQLVIHPAWHFALYSAYKLNRQGDNYNLDVLLSQFWNVCCSVSGSVTSWPTYRLLRRQVWWSGIPYLFKNFPQFIVIHTVKSFGIVNE